MIHNFKGYTPVTVTINYWLYSLYFKNTAVFLQYKISSWLIYFIHGSLWKVKVKVAQLCLALCDPMEFCESMEFSRPEYLAWGAFPFSWESSQPRDRTQVSHCRWILYQLSHRETQEYWSGVPFNILPLFCAPPPLSPLIITSLFSISVSLFFCYIH